ncbi:MAG: DUF368 domain-containing protein [Bacilli bacterium]|nr:DUF368 domain-containing protein [Bacilli bacterium]
MKEYILLIIKGMIIGLANVIPGVSGGTLMITLGIYEQVIDTISHFFKNFKKNLKFIIPLGIGVVLSLLVFSKIIGISLDKYPFATTLFFLGLIIGGLPIIVRNLNKNKDSKKVSNYIIAFLSFAFIILFAMLKSGSDINLNVSFLGLVLLFIVGVVAAGTMVIPGISGSFVLMLLGYYKPIIDTVRNITDFSLIGHNIIILGSFGIGVLVGIIGVAKLIELLLKKFETKTYYAVFGFVLASCIAIIKPLFSINLGIGEIVIGILLLLIGTFCSYKLSNI